jgi:hypothetical protein
MALSGLLGLVATGAVACGGQEVTSLPSTDPVSSNAPQFCSDAANYLTSLVPQIIPLVCEAAVSSTTVSDCATEYQACLSEASSVNTQQTNLGSTFLPDCENAVAECKVDVGQLSQCISDFGSLLVSLSNNVTPETACASSSSSTTPNNGFTNAFSNLQIPASCKSLPAGCPIGSTSVSVSSGGTTTK